MDSVHEETRHGLTIKIFQDEMQESPKESGDDSLFLVASHRDFCVKCPKALLGVPMEKTHFVFPLEAYIHSGVVLALASEGNFPDRQWDVSQLGQVFVSKEFWNTRNAARKAALSLIQSWNDYLSGNVYGYTILDAAGNDIDSCWGYSGDYNNKEYGALSEAQALVDKITNKGATDHLGQRLMDFAKV